MIDTETRFEELVEKFRDYDYRLTPQRVALLHLLVESREHPSASQLYEQLRGQFPTTSLATVYKTLAVLKDMGEVLELGFSDDDNRYDGRATSPHAHLVCVRCHKIVDSDVAITQDLVWEAAEHSGFQIVSHRLDFYGYCPECQ